MQDKISYNPETGEFIWLVSGYRNKIGMRAGSQNNQGYRHLYIDKNYYKEHRLAFFLMTGNWPDRKNDIDHINGIKNDNRWSNLREVTRSQNLKYYHERIKNEIAVNTN